MVNSEEKQDNIENANIYSFVVNKIFKKYEESKNSPNFMNCFAIYSVLFIFILVTPFFLYNLAYNDVPIDQRTMNGSVFYMIVFVILFFCIIFLDNQSKVIANNRNVNTVVAFSTMIFVTALIGTAMYFYNNKDYNFSKTYTMYADIALYVIIFLIILISLALVYKIFIQKLRNQDGIIGFIINFIFFIPCLFGDFIDFLKYQFKITSNIVFILFILEILLIIAFIYIPILIDGSINKDKMSLLPGSTFINKAVEIANSDNLAPFINKNSDGNDTKTPRLNYGLSMWTYLNQQPNKHIGTRLINIFSYGEMDVAHQQLNPKDVQGTVHHDDIGTNNSVHPQVSYFEKGKNDSNRNIYRVTFTGSQESIDHEIAIDNSYDIELTSQKWNHLFFNYHSNSVDLFINGVLERTFDMKGNIPKYNILDKMTIGSNDGLDGAICNVTYYKTVLTKFQITNLYNLLMNKNPPINNII